MWCPCSCGQVYIETRLKEHLDTYEQGMAKKLAMVEMHHHSMHWDKSSVLHGSWQEVGGSANPGDTSTRWLQMEWRNERPKFLDNSDKEAGRKVQPSPTFDF